MNASLTSSMNSTIVRSRISLWAVVRAYFARRLAAVARSGAPPGGAPVHAAAALRRPQRATHRRPARDRCRRQALARGLAGRTRHGAGRPACPWLGRTRRANGKLRRTAAGEWLSRRVVRSAGPWRERTRTGRAARFRARAASARATHGPFDAAIGHSLGAAALGLAMRRGLQLGRVVFVSPPASISEHAHKFARLLGITPAIRDAMRRRLEQRYGVRFAEIDRIDELAQLRLPALFVHDSGDTEVPFEHTLRLSARMPGARQIKTYGLGHYRLLRDHAVVRAIVDFVRGDDDFASRTAAAPAAGADLLKASPPRRYFENSCPFFGSRYV